MLALCLSTAAVRPMGGVFLPSSLFGVSDVGAAFDFTDTSKLFQDSAGTTPVAALADPIGKALDISGKNNHATQATAANRPLFQGYASFDGVNDGLATAALTPATDKATVIFSVRCVGTSNHAVHAHGGGTAGNFDAIFLAGAAPAMRGQIERTNTAGISVAGDVADTTNAVYSAMLDFAGATRQAQVQIRKNGVLPTQNLAGTGVADPGNFAAAINYIGSWAGAFPMNGRIYRIIIIYRALSAGEIAAAERWCGSPAGIVL